MENRVQDKLKELNHDLGIDIEKLWRESRQVHDRQSSRNGNENGFNHVERVEHNIGRLLNETEKNSRQKWIDRLEDYELFILSCAACCHDFDKALDLPEGFKHGEGSGDFVVKNRDKLGLKEHQADAVCSAIAIHDRDGETFRSALAELRREEATPLGTFDLRRVAVLLKAADTLHCDSSRVSDLAVDKDKLQGLDRQKHVARSCIKGWRIDGGRILIQAKLDTKERVKAFEAAFKYMQEREWTAVSEALQSYGFPYEIDKADGDVPNALLESLGAFSFTVPEAAKRVVLGQQSEPPLVVITTNEERELPRAFLRRCLVLQMDFDKVLLLKRGRDHFGNKIAKDVYEQAADLLLQDREAAPAFGPVSPGLAEYIDLLDILAQHGGAREQRRRLDQVRQFVCAKNPKQHLRSTARNE